MNVKNTAKWLGIAGATYLVGTAVSNELFDTNFKTIGNWDTGTWSGAQTADSLQPVSTTVQPINTEANLGSALSAATSVAQNAPQSLLGKIGSGLLDFAKSPAGGTLIGSAMQGLAAGKAQEAAINEQRRYTRAFTPEEMAQIGGGSPAGGGVSGVSGNYATGGYLDRARRVSEFLNERRQPSVGSPASPDKVASYARGG